MYHNDERLSLKSDVFSALREQFDTVLNRTIGNMQMRGASEAVITMKMSVSTEKEMRTTPEGQSEFLIPRFKHDISSVMQVKDKVSGELVGDYQLVWDEDERKYVMRKIDDGQTSLYDEEEPWGNFADYRPGLPDGEVVDAVVSSDDPDAELYEYLIQFVGDEMSVHESMGNYSLRRKNDSRLILSSAVEPSDPIYCADDVMAPFEDKNLICSTCESEDGKKERVLIECTDDDSVMLEVEVDVPEEADDLPDLEPEEPADYPSPDDEDEEEYEYEEPED